MIKGFIRYSFSKYLYSPLQLFRERNLLYQYTSELLNSKDFVHANSNKLRKDQVLSMYCGYDPTADSLHLGNLVSIIMMARLHKFLNLRPIFLLGGATGLIGDPSGKKQQRDLIAESKVQSNLQSITNQIETVYSKIYEDLSKNIKEYGFISQQHQTESPKPLFINNYSFYQDMSVLTFLREIGKVLRMNNLLSKQIVSNRLQTMQGLSYTQFSYSILQSYDFYVLNKEYGCILQFGGSDQWGNITNGCDLTKRLSKGQLQGFGITMPLLLTKNGEKFGKSEGNALFLNSRKTPISHIYDYFYNIGDDEIEKLLKIFSFYSPAEIQKIMEQHRRFPQRRKAQKLLAQKICSWLGEYTNIKQELLKISTEVLKKKQQEELEEMFRKLADQMRIAVNSEEIENSCKHLADLLVKLRLSKSKNEARKDIQSESIYINNEKVPSNYNEQSLQKILSQNKLKDAYILLRKGKKKCLFIKIISR